VQAVSVIGQHGSRDKAVVQLRYIQAQGRNWDEIRQNMMASPLYQIGDCTLVWVNEGDFWALNPTNVAVEEKDRREYERLKAKFEK
jgi:hypothetical protein